MTARHSCSKLHKRLDADERCITHGSIALATVAISSDCRAVLPFKPNYRLAHPEKYLFLLSKKKILDQSIQKIFYFILKKEALLLCG